MFFDEAGEFGDEAADFLAAGGFGGGGGAEPLTLAAVLLGIAVVDLGDAHEEDRDVADAAPLLEAVVADGLDG